MVAYIRLELELEDPAYKEGGALYRAPTVEMHYEGRIADASNDCAMAALEHDRRVCAGLDRLNNPISLAQATDWRMSLAVGATSGEFARLDVATPAEPFIRIVPSHLQGESGVTRGASRGASRK